MKLALVNPGNHRHVQPPLGLAYIASYAREYGDHEVVIIDENSGDTIEKFVKTRPDVIGITATTVQYPDALRAAEKLRKVFDGVPILIGGVHVTAIPDLTLKNHFFDIGVVGEGEETVLELLEVYERDGGFEKKNLEGVKGIAFRNDGRVVVTDRRPYIQNLDSIPFPARDLLNMDGFYVQPRRVIRGIMKRTTQIMSSRGCPYDCIFCASKAMWNRKVRFFSPEYVVREIRELIDRYGITALFFQDDTLTADRKRVREICRLMREEGISDEIIWSCQLRSNLVDREVLHDMKQAGCMQAEFGFESGSPRILEMLKGKSVALKGNKNAIELCKKEGLRVLGNFIVGSPTETGKEVMETHSFIVENRMDFVHVHIATPFPGTKLWTIAKQRGIIDEDGIDWSKFQMSQALEDNIIIADEIPRDELLRLYEQISTDVRKFNEESLMLGDIREFLNVDTLKRVAKTPRHVFTYGPAFIKKVLGSK